MEPAPKPADAFEERILAEHGPAALRAVQRFLRPPPPKPKPRLKSTEPAQPGQVFTRASIVRRRVNRDSRD